MLDKLTVKELKQIIIKYNLHVAITNYSTMLKKELIKNIREHLQEENGKLSHKNKTQQYALPKKEEKTNKNNTNLKKKYLKILELDSNPTKEQIKKNYRKLSLKYHPDKLGGDKEKFILLKQAYDYFIQ